MKYAVINPLDNTVHSIAEAISPDDLPPLPGAPYVVLANEDTAVGDNYDHDTATFTKPPPEVEPGTKANKASSHESGKSSHDSGSSARSR
jgi:hypothetical protein